MENHCNILRKSFVSEGVALFLAVLFEVYLKEFASKFCEDLSSSLPFSPQRCAVGLCSICSLQCTQRQRVRRAHFFLKTPCEDTTKTTTMRGMRTAAPPPQRRRAESSVAAGAASAASLMAAEASWKTRRPHQLCEYGGQGSRSGHRLRSPHHRTARAGTRALRGGAALRSRTQARARCAPACTHGAPRMDPSLAPGRERRSSGVPRQLQAGWTRWRSAHGSAWAGQWAQRHRPRGGRRGLPGSGGARHVSRSFPGA